MGDETGREATRHADWNGVSTQITRRGLLAGASLAIATAGAGCVGTTPMPYTTLSVAVADSLEVTSPMTIPIEVEVTLQNVDSMTVGLAGVAVGAYDREGARLDGTQFEAFTYEGAGSDRQTVEDHDTGPLSSATTYTAQWTLPLTLETPTVPEWLTFTVGNVWFEADERGTRQQFVGRAQATTPPPKLSATVLQYAGDRPAAGTLTQRDFERHRLGGRRSVDELLAADPMLPVGADAGTESTASPSQTETPTPPPSESSSPSG